MNIVINNQWAKKVLQLDEDFDNDIIEMYLGVANGQVINQTGYDFSKDSDLDADYVDYIRKSLLMQHYGADGYNKEYDFTFGMHADLTRLSLRARKLLEVKDGK